MTIMIAPCGVNCAVCYAHLRTRNRCPGCRAPEGKMPHCSKCAISTCASLGETKSKFCYECDRFPCQRLRRLDRHYRTRYGESVVENLRTIEREGLKIFTSEHLLKWKCPACGARVCIHTRACSSCGKTV